MEYKLEWKIVHGQRVHVKVYPPKASDKNLTLTSERFEKSVRGATYVAKERGQ